MRDLRHTLILQEVAAGLAAAGCDLPLKEVRAIADRCCQRLKESGQNGSKPKPVPILLNAKETARFLRCSVQTLRRYVEEEGLRAVAKNPSATKVQWLFRMQDLEDFLELKSKRVSR